MERSVRLMSKKVLSIIDCYFRVIPLEKTRFNSEGITIQGLCDDKGFLVTTFIPRGFLENYECKESMVVSVPKWLNRIGGKCLSIEILWVDSWRVKSVFKSNNGVTYEVLSNTMYELSPPPDINSGIPFNRYVTAKKFVAGLDGNIGVSVSDGEASFKGGRLSTFTVGEDGEPYCKIPVECLRLLNKF